MDMAIDSTAVIIETDRLILRGWQKRDLDDFFEYASVDGVGEMAGWHHHETKEETQNILNSFISGKNVFAIVYKENNKVIGSLGLHPSWANEDEKYSSLINKDIGYVLSKDYWGKGIMPEAVKAVIEYFFHHSDIEAFTCGHYEINAQSQRVIEKCGFQFVKRREFHAENLGKTFQGFDYILLKQPIK